MPARLPPNALRFKRRLLNWFRQQGRELPWRATRNPYRVLVSEFMLQQTQVKRVSEYYPRFLSRFPTVRSLANARPSQVRAAWDGLGYYRRAANLHRLARTVVRDHGGAIPEDPAALMRLPGVGRYTAGAVASFAYERRAPAVDTNVARVLGRVFEKRGSRGRGGRRGRDAPTGRRHSGTAARRHDHQPAHDVWDLAERLLPKHRKTAWEFNQALMDLGATVCTARSPTCQSCPVQPACDTGARIT